jgi:hypothetical protein
MYECPDCEHPNEESASHCARCGAELFEELAGGCNANAFADLAVHRGHTAAFLQLNDIFTNELSVMQTRSYLTDLYEHLDQEVRHFERMPPIWQNSAYTEGVALVLEGLLVLQEVVQLALREDRPPDNWLETAMEADFILREGTDLLAVA